MANEWGTIDKIVIGFLDNNFNVQDEVNAAGESTIDI